MEGELDIVSDADVSGTTIVEGGKIVTPEKDIDVLMERHKRLVAFVKEVGERQLADNSIPENKKNTAVDLVAAFGVEPGNAPVIDQVLSTLADDHIHMEPGFYNKVALEDDPELLELITNLQTAVHERFQKNPNKQAPILDQNRVKEILHTFSGFVDTKRQQSSVQ